MSVDMQLKFHLLHLVRYTRVIRILNSWLHAIDTITMLQYYSEPTPVRGHKGGLMAHTFCPETLLNRVCARWMGRLVRAQNYGKASGISPSMDCSPPCPIPVVLSIAHRGFLNGTAESRERVRQAHDVTHMMVGYNVTFCEITENVH